MAVPSRSLISRLNRMMASSPSRTSDAGADSLFLPPPPMSLRSTPSFSSVLDRPLRLPPFSRASPGDSARIHAGVSSSSFWSLRRRSRRSPRSRSLREELEGAGFQAGRPGAVRPPSRAEGVVAVEEFEPVVESKGFDGRLAADRWQGAEDQS